VTKKRAKRGFIILSIVLALGLFLTFCPFYISFNYSTFNGFFNAVALGTDLAGGKYSVYECELNDFNNATDFNLEMDKAVSSLQGTLNGMGYRSAIVTKEDGNKIRVETANYQDLQDVDGYIGSYASIYITDQKEKTESEAGFDVSNPSGTYITTKNISSVSNSFAGAESTFNIMLYFDAEGAKLYNEITKLASAEGGSGNVYVYVIDNEGNPVQINNGSNYIELPCSEESADNFLGFSSSGFTSTNAANLYTLPFIVATYGVKLDLAETEEITPVLGESALTCIIIACFVSLALAILLLVYRYGDFGWLAGLSTIFFLVLNMFLLQAIPNIVISMGSLVALLITYFVLFNSFIIIFEKIREEYRLGKKIPLAVKGGFKKSAWPIADMCIISALLGFILCFFGNTVFTSIGFILLVGSALTALTIFFTTKLICDWYCYLNSTKAKRLNLVKDKTLVIKDEIVVADKEEGSIQWKNLI